MGAKKSKISKEKAEQRKKGREVMVEAAKARVERTLPVLEDEDAPSTAGGSTALVPAGAGAGAGTSAFRIGKQAVAPSVFVKAQLDRHGKCFTKPDLIATLTFISLLKGHRYTAEDVKRLSNMTCEDIRVCIRSQVYSSPEALAGMAGALTTGAASAEGGDEGTEGKREANAAVSVPAPSAPPMLEDVKA